MWALRVGGVHVYGFYWDEWRMRWHERSFGRYLRGVCSLNEMVNIRFVVSVVLFCLL